MRLNLILAFAAGLALASGLMVVGVKHYRQPVQPLATPVVLADATPTQLPDAAPIADPLPAPKASVEHVHATHSPATVHIPKPSPMPELAVAEPPQPQPAAPEPRVTPAPGPPEEERTIPPPIEPEPQETQPVQARNSPAPVAPPAPELAPEPAPPPPQPQTAENSGPPSVTLQRGTQLRVRIGETLSTDRNRPGDHFLATLEQPLVIDGFVIAERGARVEGEVVASNPAPRGGGGVSHLAIRLVRLETSDRQNIPIQTGLWNRAGGSSSGRDAATILATTAIGAAIGGMAGGGRGAAIGAAAGGAAGTAGVMAARGPSAVIPVETRLTFEVVQPLHITERLD